MTCDCPRNLHRFAALTACCAYCHAGKYDHRWSHSTPLLEGEIQPRECDLFSEPRLIDSWRNGATALPIYESFTEFMIPLQDNKITLQKFWLHVRGSRTNGMVQVNGPGSETTEWDRPPPGKLKVVVRVTAQNTTGLNDWHVCKAGSIGEEGVVITGPYDGKRPVVSPWLEGYTKFVVAIIFPHDIDFPGAKKQDYLLDSMSMSLENMAVDVRGDLVKPGLAKNLNVLTKNAAVVVNVRTFLGVSDLVPASETIFLVAFCCRRPHRDQKRECGRAAYIRQRYHRSNQRQGKYWMYSVYRKLFISCGTQ